MVDIVNDMLDMTANDIPPKQIRVGDCYYAFLKDTDYEDDRFVLWINDEVDGKGSWAEVSDLSGVYVWEYQEIKSYAVAIGWIKEDQDLFI